MDWNKIEGSWKRYKGNIREQWGNLSDEDLEEIDGKRERLESKIQQRYHISPEQAQADIDVWYQRVLNKLFL